MIQIHGNNSACCDNLLAVNELRGEKEVENQREKRAQASLHVRISISPLFACGVERSGGDESYCPETRFPARTQRGVKSYATFSTLFTDGERDWFASITIKEPSGVNKGGDWDSLLKLWGFVSLVSFPCEGSKNPQDWTALTFITYRNRAPFNQCNSKSETWKFIHSFILIKLPFLSFSLSGINEKSLVSNMHQKNC